MARVPPAEHHGSLRHAEIRRHARAHFDRWALDYDRSRLNELVFFPTMRACQEELVRWQAGRATGVNLAAPATGGGANGNGGLETVRRAAPPFRMLDVGCGTGTLLSLVARDPSAEQLVGVDYSPVMVRRFAEKIADSPYAAKLQAIQADAERLPFAAASFDVVTCCNSFHHYPHQANVIGGVRRVLRPGGLFVLVDGFRDNFLGWLIFDAVVAHVERNVHHATWRQVRDMLRDAGFNEVHQRKLNVLAPLLVTVGLVA